MSNSMPSKKRVAVPFPDPIDDQAPTGASLYEERAPRLFELGASRCWIDLYDHSSHFPASAEITKPGSRGRTERQQAQEDIE